ncbi:MAG TPA: hypothetical protein VF517_11895 [Thermoleophilaceae bacterium]|jgi:hypothetical protein
MRTHPVKEFAAEAARTVGRRVRARRRGHHADAAPAAPAPRSIPLPQVPLNAAKQPANGALDARGSAGADELHAPEAAADDGELDALRGALVRELDRLAADDDCSASFRRA